MRKEILWLFFCLPFSSMHAQTDVSPEQNISHIVEQDALVAPSHNVSVVEFSDDGRKANACKGNLQSPCQEAVAVQKIEDARTALPDGSRLVVLVFIHGWHHSASPGDNDLIRFGEMIDCLNLGSQPYITKYGGRAGMKHKDWSDVACEDQPLPSNVHYEGVYIGWHGARLKGFLDLFSLGPAAKAGERVADNDLPGVLKNLSKASKAVTAKPPARLIVVGHSLGGLIAERVATNLYASSLTPAPSGCSQSTKQIDSGIDLFLLLNPASNAISARQLIDSMLATKFCPSPVLSEEIKRPYIVSLHSKTDPWTGYRGCGFRRFFARGTRYTGPDFPVTKRSDSEYAPTAEMMQHCTSGQLIYFSNMCFINSEEVSPSDKTGDPICNAINDEIEKSKRESFDAAGLSSLDTDDGAYELAAANGTVLQMQLTKKLAPYLAYGVLPTRSGPSPLLNLYVRRDYVPVCKKTEEEDADLKLCALGEIPISGALPWNNSPYWIFNVPDSIISEHSDLWTTKLVALVSDLAGSFPIVQSSK